MNKFEAATAVRNARVEAGLSQRDLSRLASVGLRSIQRIENAKRDNLTNLAERLVASCESTQAKEKLVKVKGLDAELAQLREAKQIVDAINRLREDGAPFSLQFDRTDISCHWAPRGYVSQVNHGGTETGSDLSTVLQAVLAAKDDHYRKAAE